MIEKIALYPHHLSRLLEISNRIYKVVGKLSCEGALSKEPIRKEDLDKALEYDTRNSSTYLTAANYYLIKGDIDRTLEEAGYAELYAQNDEEQLKEILMFYFQHTFFKDTIRVGKALEELFGDKARKYSYVMAYSYYAINSHSDEMIKYMVRTIVYNPKLLTLTEKSPFVDAARRVNEMLEEGIIKKEDYL